MTSRHTGTLGKACGLRSTRHRAQGPEQLENVLRTQRSGPASPDQAKAPRSLCQDRSMSNPTAQATIGMIVK